MNILLQNGGMERTRGDREVLGEGPVKGDTTPEVLILLGL